MRTILIPTILLFVSQISRAGTTFYIGPDNGLWTTGSNWDAGVPPRAGDDAIVGQFIPPRTGDVNVTFNGNYQDVSAALNSLTLDATGTTGKIIFNQTDPASAMFAPTQYIGSIGLEAIYNQSSGTNDFPGYLNLGYLNGFGRYNLSGTATLSGTNLVVGSSGSGSFSQTGGTVTIDALLLALGLGTSGTYTLAAGTLFVNGTIFVGGSGPASFLQTGGVHTAGSLSIGNSFASSCSYTLEAGTLSAGSLEVNEGGTFQMNGGSLTLTGGSASMGIAGATFNYFGGDLTFPDGGIIAIGEGFNFPGAFVVAVPLSSFNVSVYDGSLFQVTAGSTAFTDTFTVTGTGAYISIAPSRQDFTSLVVDLSGYLKGGAGDVFTVANSLTVTTDDNIGFEMELSRIVLTGTGVTHRMTWPGTDVGATASGYDDNFALGVVELSSGGSLVLIKGGPTTMGAIYTEVLQLDDGISQISSISGSGDISIYYDPNNAANSYLGGNTYSINGGGVIAPVPGKTPPPDPTATPTPPTSTPTPSPTPTPTPNPFPVQFGNISTRANVGNGDTVLIGGFIITGNGQKKVIIRALGPSLPLGGLLADPFLELHDQAGATIAFNDDWIASPDKQAIIDSQLAPSNDKEAAMIMTLNPGAYTAIVRGADGGSGIALVEVYDPDQTADCKLANISTRGFVETSDNVMIGGLIVLGTEPTESIIRAIGPSLLLGGPLGDPTLDLYGQNGEIMASNDNWRSDQESEIMATGLAPTKDAESAIVVILNPGAYTAIVRGKNETIGIGLVEAYQLDN